LKNIHASYSKIFADSDLTQATKSLIEEIRYNEEIQRSYHDPDEVSARQASLQELVNAVAQYCENDPDATLDGFLSDVTLDGRDFNAGNDKQIQRNAISLMTYHSAKGLEFPIVYMVGMEEGILPHRRSEVEDTVDEERRLCYVGITRAQEELTLTMAMSRKKWGKDRPTFPSRFLYELTGQSDNPNRLRSIQAARDDAKASTKAKPQRTKS
jgi:DNA helicase-2/ATP-dependent DNA helicase PcrA